MLSNKYSAFLNLFFKNCEIKSDAAIQIYANKPGERGWKPRRFTDIPSAANFIQSKEGDHHIFFNVALIGEVEKGRGSNKDARVLPALFADLDASGGSHQDGKKLASKEELLQMITSDKVVPSPSLVIDSGGGFHCYWIFETPLTDMLQASKLLEGLNNSINTWQKSKGYKYEKLKDLARVLRVARSKNFKFETPVEVLPVWPEDRNRLKRFSPNDFKFEVEVAPVTTDFDVDEDLAISTAMQKCLRVEREWGSDASSYVIKCCRQCVKAGCSADQTVQVLKAIRQMFAFPGDWTAEAIKKRYDDALLQSELGSGLAQPELINFTLRPDPNSDKDKMLLVPKSQAELLAELDSMNLDLLNYRNELTAVDGTRLFILRRDPQFFAYLQKHAKVTWNSGLGCITKQEFLECVKLHTPTVDEIDLTPHFPPIEGRRYLTPQPIADDGAELERFLDLFLPETDHDRQLILAAVATVCWGGPPGKRPGFAIESAEMDITGQVGTGKTTAAEMIAGVPLLGGSGEISISSKTDWSRFMSHVQDAQTGSKRVILVDNIRGMLVGQEMESMVTSSNIGGHKMFQGYSSRKNYFTWIVTGNHLQTSDDMSTRLVPIRIHRPINNPDWEMRRQKIDYEKVLRGVAAFFERPPQPMSSYSRWQLWEREVLSRCNNPDQLRDLITARTARLSGIDDDAAEIRERLLHLLSSSVTRERHDDLFSLEKSHDDGIPTWCYDSSKDYVFIPSTKIAEIFEGFNGKRDWSKKSATMVLNRIMKSHFLCEVTKPKDTSKRGVIWRGILADGKPDYERFEHSMIDF